MKFETVQDAFNHYKNHSLEQVEERAAQLKGTIKEDPEADMASVNVEIEGLSQVKENIKEKEGTQERNFNPITGRNFEQKSFSKENVFASTEYRDAFYKTMLGQDLNEVEQRAFNTAMDKQATERRADDFSTTGNSAAILPTATLNEVIRKARTEGGLISHARNFNMPTNISVPIGTPSDKAQWHQEGAAVESERAQTTHVKFAGYEIIKIFSMSVATKKMSISAFESYLTEELTNCVMETIADSLVNGTGDAQGTGVLTGITWDDSNSLPLNGEYTDFTAALAKLKRGYAANAKFAMSNATLYNKVYALVDNNNRPLFVPDPRNEQVGHILGKEVVIDDNIQDDVVILGNFQYMGYNLPQGLMLESSRESSFKSGLIDYRAMAIADTKPLVEEAFIKLAVDEETP